MSWLSTACLDSGFIPVTIIYMLLLGRHRDNLKSVAEIAGWTLPFPKQSPMWPKHQIVMARGSGLREIIQIPHFLLTICPWPNFTTSLSLNILIL